MSDTLWARSVRDLSSVETAELKEPPLTEHVIVPGLFCTGAGIKSGPHTVEIVFWTHTPNFGDDGEERRITARIALPIHDARVFSRQLSKAVRIDNGH